MDRTSYALFAGPRSVIPAFLTLMPFYIDGVLRGRRI